MKAKADTPFVALNIAVLTVSDTRTFDTDTSGQLFVDRLSAAGHRLAERVLLKDDLYKIRAQVATWIADDNVQVVLITGGPALPAATARPRRWPACWTNRSRGLESCSGRSPWPTLAPPRCSRVPWPGWPTVPWCAACRARPTPCVPAGMASLPNSSMPAIARATSLRT